MANQFNNQYVPNATTQLPTAITNTIVWVETEDEAKNWMVAPNNRVFIFVGDNNALYVKEKNSDGRPLKTEIYDLERRNIIEESSQVDLTNYVRKDDVALMIEDAVNRALKQNKRRYYNKRKTPNEGE